MNICIFTTAHPWDDVRVTSKFANSFVASGHAVTWIGPDRALFSDTRAEQLTGVRYRLIPHEGGWKHRLDSWRRLRQILINEGPFDWVYCPDPDSAALAATVPRARVIFDIHEEYHKGHFTSLPDPLAKAASSAVRIALTGISKRSSFVTSVHQGILDTYRANPTQSLVLYNSPPEWFGEIYSRQSAPESFRVFHGKGAPGNGTPIVLEALAQPALATTDITTVILPKPANDAHDYDPELHLQISHLGINDKVTLIDVLPHRDMPPLMASCSLGLIAYGRTLGAGSLPNRFFEYMAVGIPSIIPTYSPLMQEISRRSKASISADFEDPVSVADAIHWASENPNELLEMGARARHHFVNEYSWRSMFAHFNNELEFRQGAPDAI